MQDWSELTNQLNKTKEKIKTINKINQQQNQPTKIRRILLCSGCERTNPKYNILQETTTQYNKKTKQTLIIICSHCGNIEEREVKL